MDMQTEADIGALLRHWDENNPLPSYDPVPLLTRMCELIELETANYLKADPDPFDERHPSRADPNCALGQILKTLVNDYLRENYWSRLGYRYDIRALNVVACRLMIDILPGLDTSVVFDAPTSVSLVQRLYIWAEKESDPLQTYATGLIAAAMEVQEIANSCRELNCRMVPLMLDRLHALHRQACAEKAAEINSDSLKMNMLRPFANLGNEKVDLTEVNAVNSIDFSQINGLSRSPDGRPVSERHNGYSQDVDMTGGSYENSLKRRKSSDYSGMTSPVPSKKHSPYDSDFSNSSWQEMECYISSSVQIFPPTLATKQMFILKYLTLVGEYQEFLSHIIEKNALQLVLQLIDHKNWQNSRLTFEALRYLAAILCHKKFAIEFISLQGVQKLLKVPKIGISATGASICFFYLAHCEDAMEKLCSLPTHIVAHVIPKLIAYNLWLLERSHDSGRCHSTMFFSLSFQFPVILSAFDEADGLRKIFNVLSILPIFASDENTRNEDEESTVRQIVKHVCTALKRYFEAQLHQKSEIDRRRTLGVTIDKPAPVYKTGKCTPEIAREQITILQELNTVNWPAVINFMQLGGIKLMLKIIAFTYEWNYSGRGETVRSALDVINICSVLPIVQLELCNSVDLPDDGSAIGVTIILGAAEGEIVVDAEVQKSALNVIITCACAPITRDRSVAILSSSKKKILLPPPTSTREDAVIQKIWDCIRTSNGIMVLTTLMVIKTPITDADAIRALACHALAGLARSETARQIISKLPLFTSGQIQNLINDPVLQDRRPEHALFQKYALELMEKVCGKKSLSAGSLEASLANMHKANVVAQTRIQYNKEQLFQIIYHHLLKHDLRETADALQREANLPSIRAPLQNTALSPFTYKVNNKGRTTLCNDSKIKKSLHPDQYCGDLSSPLNLIPKVLNGTSLVTTPIRVSLNHKKVETKNFQFSSPGRSLEKVTRCEPLPPVKPENSITLDSIITEYLANQHSLCKNPMVTCPQFDLLMPHKCPDGRVKKLMYANFATRFSEGVHMRRLDERLIHSRFSSIRTFRTSEEDGYFMCCEFANEKRLLAGTFGGSVKYLNLSTGMEDSTTSCHSSYISNISSNSEGTLCATSSIWRNPLSALWRIRENGLENLYSFAEDEVIEFSHLSEDKLIGTRGADACIYDVNTGQTLMNLKPTQSNQYARNRATFHPSDELVLSDGVLWDITSGKEIHKFDKLNQTLSGVFHPNGLEIISNAEVWDIRTFHLLRTVPALEQCNVIFPKSGRTFYAVTNEREMESENSYDTSFKTIDAYDYSIITVWDVKKYISGLSCNELDTQIATVENCSNSEEVQETAIRIYDVGRQKADDDQGDEEEEDEEEVNTDDNSDSDDQNDDSHIDFIDNNDEDNGEENEDDDDEDEFDFELVDGSSNESSQESGDDDDEDDS